MAGTIFLLVILAVAVFVTFIVGLWSLFLFGIAGGAHTESWGIFWLGVLGWLVLWGLSAWALYGFIVHLVALLS